MTKSLEYKLFYLKRLLQLYVLFTRKWNRVEVDLVDGGLYKPEQYQYLLETKCIPSICQCVKVTFCDATEEFKNKHNKDWYEHETIEFPVTHLAKRVISYKQKVAYEFQNRHNNELLWKKLQKK
jgi:hypothetical protein